MTSRRTVCGVLAVSIATRESFVGRDLSAQPSGPNELMDAELLFRVCTDAVRLPSRGVRDLAKLFNRVLVGIFRVDAFVHCEAERATADLDLLLAKADEMHLDSAFQRIVDRLVPEAALFEVGAKLPIDAAKQVEVEGRRDACSVAIGIDQNARIFLQVDADDEATSAAERAAEDLEKSFRFAR